LTQDGVKPASITSVGARSARKNIFSPNTTIISGINKLGGKTDIATPDGAFPQLFVEEYNEAHPDNPIKITYSDEDAMRV
jgi:hypothetical protein